MSRTNSQEPEAAASRRATRLIAGTMAMLLLGGSAQAGVLYWDTATTSGIQTANGTWDFNSTASWSSSTAGSNPLLPWTSNSDTASFQVGAGGNTVTVSSANGQVGATAMSFTGTGGGNTLAVSGASVQLGGGGINSTMSSQIVSVAAPLVLTASQDVGFQQSPDEQQWRGGSRRRRGLQPVRNHQSGIRWPRRDQPHSHR